MTDRKTTMLINGSTATRTGTLARTLLTAIGLLFLAATIAVQPAIAAAYEEEKNDRLADVKKALGKERFENAIELLKAHEAETPDDADVQNLLGYSHRKIGEFDTAYQHYQKALELNPKHLGANEYLGELYLQTDRLAEAEAQLATLDKLCGFLCKEKRQLKKAIKKYKAANQ